jgi:hypothetical protein
MIFISPKKGVPAILLFWGEYPTASKFNKKNYGGENMASLVLLDIKSFIN